MLQIYKQITNIVDKTIESLLKATNRENPDIQELIKFYEWFIDEFQKLNNVQLVNMLEIIKKVFIFVQNLLLWKYFEFNEMKDNNLKIEKLERNLLLKDSYIFELEYIIDKERKTSDANINVSFKFSLAIRIYLKSNKKLFTG